jgi:hypothetical protein
MDTKKMRESLRAKGIKPKQKNEEMIAQYNEEFPNEISIHSEVNDPTSFEAKQPLKLVPSDNEYTYVGAGDTPPHMIKFMGIQVFTRGQLTKVTNPRVLAKIDGNPSFVKGAVTQEFLYENDEKAAAEAKRQRESDQELQILIERENRKAG